MFIYVYTYVTWPLQPPPSPVVVAVVWEGGAGGWFGRVGWEGRVCQGLEVVAGLCGVGRRAGTRSYIVT